MNSDFNKILQMNKNFSNTLTTVTSCIISTRCPDNIIQECIVALDSCATFDISKPEFVHEIIEDTITRNINSFNGIQEIKFKQGIVLFNGNINLKVNILPKGVNINLPTNCDMLFCRKTIDKLNIDINYHLKSKQIEKLKLNTNYVK